LKGGLVGLFLFGVVDTAIFYDDIKVALAALTCPEINS